MGGVFEMGARVRAVSRFGGGAGREGAKSFGRSLPCFSEVLKPCFFGLPLRCSSCVVPAGSIKG